jgi:Domain of unknown function (DUF4062)
MENTREVDRRYQVFISSTFDMRKERKAAIEAVFEQGHIPIALERFSPANESDLEIINKAMSECQVCIFILGHRYGSLIPGTEIGFTEFEYNLAQEYGLLTLVFLLNDSIIEKRRQSLKSNLAKDQKELENFHRLNQFHDRVTIHFRKIFTLGPQFKGEVAIALLKNLPDYGKPGFIREPSDAKLIESAKNEFIGDIITEISSYKKLFDRTELYPDHKRGAAKFFVQEYMERLLANKVSLFFESGSTAAFLAQEMSERLHKAVMPTETGAPSIAISTNNILAYLILWLKSRIPCIYFPWSPAADDNAYGGAYGGLENLIPRSPDYQLPPLDQNAEREIQRLQDSPFTPTSMAGPTLLLGAASGLQLTSNHKVEFMEEGLTPAKKEELRDQLSKCFGLHGRSYQNKLFKRFLYATKLPIVIFITEDKIDCEIEVGKSHFILDSEFTWEEFYQKYPLAFCVGCTDENKKGYIKMFNDLGFDVIGENKASKISSFIARNRVFQEEFENKLT